MRGISHSEDWSWSNAPRKGGGGSTTTSQSGPPPQVLANYQQVYGQAQGVAQQPYQTYNGSTIAGFTPQQTAGFNNINTAVNAAQPFLNQASQYTTNAANMLDPSNFGGTVAGYQNPGLSPYLNGASQDITSALNQSQGIAGGLAGANFGQTVGNYYNPYAQSVIAPTQALFNEQNAQQLQQVRGNAAAQHAFGGDREAIAESETARQQQLAEAPTLAQLQSTGYAQAVQNALAAAGIGQQTAGLTMQGAGQNLAAGNLQQQGYNAATSAAQANAWLNSQAGFGMGNLANEAQSLGLQGANAQIGAGGMQQQMAQQELNVPYQQFLAAQGYPFQVTNWLEGMATGTGGASGQQGSTTSPGPSGTSQAIGLGLTGAGLIGSLNQAGAFNSGVGAAGNALSAANLSSGIDSGGLLVAHGGRIARAPGGGVPGMAPGVGNLPWDAPLSAQSLAASDAAINVIPQPRAGSGPSLLAPTGSTTTGGGASGGQQAQQALGDVAAIAGIAAMFMDRGGRIDDAKLRALRSLRGIEIPRRDVGGSIQDPAMTAMFQGNPMSANIYNQYQQLPVEKLQEIAARMPQNQMVQRALQMRHMAPQAAPQPPPAQTPGLGGPPDGQQMQTVPGGFAAGGDVGDDYSDSLPLGFSSLGPWMQPPQQRPPHMGPITADNTSDWRDSAPPLGQTAGLGPSPVGGPYSDFRLPVGGRPQDQQSSDYADFRMPPGGRPQDEMAPATVPIAGLSRPSIPMPEHTSAYATTSGPASAQHPANTGMTGEAPEGEIIPPGYAAQHSGMSGPWGTLLATGLGIMGGASPFASVNIGRGGLQGLQYGENIKLREEQQALRMQQAADLAQYRRDTIDFRHQQLPIQQQRANDYSTIAQGRNAHDIASAAWLQNKTAAGPQVSQAQLAQQTMQSLTQTTNPDTGRPFTQAEAYDHVRGFQFKQQSQDLALAKAFDTHQQHQAQLTQGAQRIQQGDAKQQALEQFRASGQALTQQKMDYLKSKGATDQDIRVYTGQLVAGTPKPSMEGAHSAAENARAMNTPGANGQGLPMPKSAAEAVKGQVYSTGRGPATWDGQQFIPLAQ